MTVLLLRAAIGDKGGMDRLPIDDVLDEVVAAVATAGRVVLMAPPRCGQDNPRAARAFAACHGPDFDVGAAPSGRAGCRRTHGANLGERQRGETVGYRMRGASKVSKTTRIEVVTEGILTRMLQSDPELRGVGCVIFDEFHERSLNADFGLALVQEVRGGAARGSGRGGDVGNARRATRGRSA